MEKLSVDAIRTVAFIIEDHHADSVYPRNRLDIIGDIHGEISALESLLEHLGYDETGSHPESRKMVFVGDLVDRGENSWAVYKKSARLSKMAKHIVSWATMS